MHCESICARLVNAKLMSISYLIQDDIYEHNSFEHPGRVKPRNMPLDRKTGSLFDINIPRLSWNVIRIGIRT